LSSAARSEAKTIRPLTSIRFFAAFFVVLHHSAHVFLPAFSGMFLGPVPNDFGSRMLLVMAASVSFFFMLSGYVLSVAYLRERKAIDTGGFFAARFARVCPLYFLMIVLCTPEVLVGKVREFGLAGGLVKTGVAFAAHIAMVQAWFPARVAGIDGPSWSLSVEAFFYLCFPVLGVLLWRLRGALLPVTALGLHVGGQALLWAARPHLNERTLFFWPPLHLSTFALGVVLARWQILRETQAHRPVVRVWQVNFVLLLSGAGIMATVVLLPYFHLAELFRNGLLAPVFAGIIWASSARSSWWSRLLSGSWLVALGDASYAMYLLHIPLLGLFQYLHWTSQAQYPAYLALCVGVSLLSFFYFETPARLWLLARFRVRPLETVNVASIAQ
jgi:peptidoglycan/LPS O-acetylase OafA/YrhL